MPTFSGKMGQLLVNEAIPKDLRDGKVLDADGLKTLLQNVAQQHPTSYRDISHKLTQLGEDAAQQLGGYSFGLNAMRRAQSANVIRDRIRGQVQMLLDDDSLSDDARETQIVKLLGQAQGEQEKAVYDESLKEDNPIALQIKSGARGKKMALNSLRGSDLLYVDHRDRPVPIPVLRSYAEGLSPAEYWAGAYGARHGIVSVKLGTAQSGFLAKQLNQATHRLLVTHEDDAPVDTVRGLPVPVDDNDNVGALLAHPAGGYGRNTVLTPKVLKNLHDGGIDRILVRSPTVGGAPDGGLYSRDVGVRETGQLPPKGTFSGLQAGQAISEPLSQATLCLAKGTLVRMADLSIRPVEQIEPNEMVLGADSDGNTFPVRVMHRFDNGQRDCVKTEFNVGLSKEKIQLVSTPEHKVLAKTRHWAIPHEECCDGVFPVGEREGRRCVGFAAMMPRSLDYTGGRNEPFALLMGLLLGDGCYTESVHGVHLSCFDPSLIQDVTPYLRQLGLKATKLQGHIGYYQISQIQDGPGRRDALTGRMLSGCRNPAKLMLLDRDMYGKYAHEKTIPDDVWSWNQESVAMLLAGLFVTDGSVYCNAERAEEQAYYFGFGSTSRQMVETVRDLLRIRFAIFAGPISTQNKKRKHAMHQFTVTRNQDVRRLGQLIPLFGVKDRVMQEFLGGGLDSDNKDYRYFYRHAQTSIGRLETFDLEVDHPDHLFVLANGLIVSNSAKHAGGVAGASKSVSGFAWINALVQIPKVFPGGATHSQVDGRVQQITKALGGGLHVQVNGHEHYVPHGLELAVQPGDAVEAGDVLSEGIPSPAEIVKHKGIGEGRRYFVDAMRKALTDSGVRNNRRNLELISRGLINHVELDEEIGEHAPEDVVPFDTIEHDYQPRPDSRVVPVHQAVGQYLEKPYLHHTIGTQVKSSMLADFKHFGVESVHVHKDPAPFHPVMVRGMYNLQHDPDALTRNLGSGLQASFLESVHRGGHSDERGTSYVPSLARTVDFGRTGVIRPPVVTPQRSTMKTALFGFGDSKPGQAVGGSPIKPLAPAAGVGGSPKPMVGNPAAAPAAAAPAPPPSPALSATPKPSPNMPAGEIGGFGDFFNHFGNLLRGPGYDAGMAPATKDFRSSVAPKQFGQQMLADGFHTPPPPAQMPTDVTGSYGHQLGTAEQLWTLGRAGVGLAGRWLPRVARLGGWMSKANPVVSAATFYGNEPVRGIARLLGGSEETFGKPLDVPALENDVAQGYNEKGNLFGTLHALDRASANPMAANASIAKGIGWDIPKALWNANTTTATKPIFDTNGKWVGYKSGEDAPGIPSRDVMGDLSRLEPGKLYSLFTQLHNATKAGPHHDVRIGSPETGLYSWAVPKGVPEPGQKHLAVRQPLHSHAYGSWSGTIPEGEYGAGKVTSQIKGQALVTESGPGKLHFTTAHEKYPKRYAIVAPKSFEENHHLLLNTTPTEPLPYQKIRYNKVPPEQVEEKLQNLPEGSSVQAKIDGASSLAKLLKDTIELYSYRESAKGGPITHTEKIFHGRPKIDIPPEYHNSVLRGELHGVRTDAAGKETVIHPSELGGILNATLANSLAKQQAGNIQLRSALFDIQQVGNKPIDFATTPYSERREHLKSILPSLPQDIFSLTPEVHTPEEATKLWHETASGQHPSTEEGIVVHPPTGKPWKAKHIEDHDVYVRNIFPGEGRLAGTHAGGFDYSAEPDGPVLGRVGTGFSDDVRKQMHERPDDFVGRVARVKSQEKLQSGALRAPAYIALHEDYPAAPVLNKAAELERVRQRVKELVEKRSESSSLSTARERLQAIRAKNLGL